MNLIHYSKNPKIELEVGYRYSSNIGLGKPSGLWVSDDDEEPNWKSWALAEDFNLPELKYCYRIELCKNANILKLTTQNAIRRFTYKFGNVNHPIEKYLDIDWNKVRTIYQGIIITPYQWKLRHTFLWYYGWDCASGCIWDISTVKTLTRVGDLK